MQGSSATATCLNTSSTYLMISRMQLIKTELEPVLLNDDTTCTISHIYVRDICTPQTDHRKYLFFFYTDVSLFRLHTGNTVKLGAMMMAVLVAKCRQSNLFS